MFDRDGKEGGDIIEEMNSQNYGVDKEKLITLFPYERPICSEYDPDVDQNLWIMVAAFKRS